MDISRIMGLVLILVTVGTIIGTVSGTVIGTVPEPVLVDLVDEFAEYHSSTKEAMITISDTSNIIKSANIVFRHDGGQVVVHELTNLNRSQHIINVPMPVNIVDVTVNVICKIQNCVGKTSPNDHVHNTIFIHQRKSGMEPNFDMNIVVDRIGHGFYYPDTVVTIGETENKIVDESKTILRVEGHMPIVNTVHAFLPMEPVNTIGQ
jgi:hypothetical protein